MHFQRRALQFIKTRFWKVPLTRKDRSGRRGEIIANAPHTLYTQRRRGTRQTAVSPAVLKNAAWQLTIARRLRRRTSRCGVFPRHVFTFLGMVQSQMDWSYTFVFDMDVAGSLLDVGRLQFHLRSHSRFIASGSHGAQHGGVLFTLLPRWFSVSPTG